MSPGWDNNTTENTVEFSERNLPQIAANTGAPAAAQRADAVDSVAQGRKANSSRPRIGDMTPEQIQRYACSPSMNRVVKALESHGPMTMAQIAEKAHVNITTLRSDSYMAILVAAQRAHVSGWNRHPSGGNPTQIFSAGQGENVPRPEPIPKKELCRQYQIRSGYNEARKARRRLERPRDPALAALLGLAA